MACRAAACTARASSLCPCAPAVTIPNVVACIDFGRHKQAEFVPRAGCTMLRATWVSQASAAQRAGRAGRVQPGVVFRLYSRAFHDSVMPRYDSPEMMRLSLENVVLVSKGGGRQGTHAVLESRESPRSRGALAARQDAWRRRLGCHPWRAALCGWPRLECGCPRQGGSRTLHPGT